MGILNITPDSFSDGGRYLDPTDACRRAEILIREGADLLDIGGESTRPGSSPVPALEEIRRILPVIEETVKLGVPVSVDTRKASVARKALEAGAAVINDISGLDDPDMAGAAADAEAGLVLMHMRGTPRTMQDHPEYDDVVGEVAGFLDARRARGGGSRGAPGSGGPRPGNRVRKDPGAQPRTASTPVGAGRSGVPDPGRSFPEALHRNPYRSGEPGASHRGERGRGPGRPGRGSFDPPGTRRGRHPERPPSVRSGELHETLVKPGQNQLNPRLEPVEDENMDNEPIVVTLSPIRPEPCLIS